MAERHNIVLFAATLEGLLCAFEYTVLNALLLQLTYYLFSGMQEGGGNIRGGRKKRGECIGREAEKVKLFSSRNPPKVYLAYTIAPAIVAVVLCSTI